MKSIDCYLEGKCNNNKKILNEFGVLETILTVSAVRIAFLSLGYVQLYFSSLKAYNSSVSDKELENIISKLVNDDVEVKIVPIDEANAYNMGGKTLYILTGLYNQLTTNERVAILLHEYAHYKNKDSFILNIKSHISGSIMLSIGTILFSMISAPTAVLPVIYMVLLSMHSKYLHTYMNRRAEERADKLVIDHGYGKHFASAFKKLLKLNNIPVKKTKCISMACKIRETMKRIESTHPDDYKRIENALNTNASKVKNVMSKGFIPAFHNLSTIFGIDVKSIFKSKIGTKFYNILTKTISEIKK